MSQKIYSNLDIKGNAKIGDITNATSDTDKFLVSDAGVVKYRTGSEMLSDLGVAPGVASNIQHQVKAGVAINKGQAVYVTGADGTNMIVGLASNSAELTSSKTMGLMASTVATNGFGNVIAEGLLAGLDTSTANAGDPVWLGTNGNLIYGLANKPSAPNHLVFIGIVTRANANNGEIFVKIQNGFELNEIHDVDTKTAAPVGNDILAFEGAPVNLWKNKTIASVLGYTPVSQSRTLTINGTTFDLSADRSWTIASGVTSFNTRTGAITLTSGDVTGALGYTPYNATNPNGYISSYTETDTLATVTARGASTSSAITLSNSLTLAGFGSNSFINGTGDGSSFSTYNFALSGWSSMAFYNPTSGGTYPTQVCGLIDFREGRINMKGGFRANGQIVLHEGNFNSWAPTVQGGNASGTWPISITGNADTVDNLHATDFVRAYGTSNDNIDSDWGQSFKTFDPIPSGTPPISSPNLRTINIGENYSRRTQLSFDYAANRAWFRRRQDSTWSAWSEFIHSENISSFAVPSSRTITINGTSYDLSANRSWTVTAVETDTLQTVTSRGNTSSNPIILRTSYPYMQFEDTVTGTTKFAWQQLGVTLAGSGAGGGGYFTTYSQDKPFGWTVGGNQGVMTIDTSGNVQALSSSRSPIFYDSNNTGYYVDPASTSNLNLLTMANKITVGSFPNSTTNNGEAWLGRAADRPSGTMTVQLGGNLDRKFEVVDYGWTTVNFQVNGYGAAEASGSMRAPIFYDSNDTSYYLDANSTSRLYQVNAPQGYISNGNPWGTANSAYFPNGITTAGSDNWIYGHTYVGNAPANGAGHEFWGSGKEYHRSSEATTSQGASGRWLSIQSANGNFIPYSFESEYGNHSWGTVARFRINQAGADRPSIQFSSASSDTRWNIGYCYADDNFRITQNMGYRNNNSTEDGWGTERLIIYTDGNIYSNGLYQSNASLRAPLFYDSNNTGYYLDPASTSELNKVYYNSNMVSRNYGIGQVGLYTSTRYQGVFSMGEAYVLPADGTSAGNLYGLAWSHPNAGGVAGNLNTHGLLAMENGTWLASLTGSTRARDDMRAPIFYDNNNTGYYIDPAGNSQVSAMYANNWFRAQGNTGLYGQDYGVHFYPQTGSAWSITGSGGNIELQFRSNHNSTIRGYVYADTSNNIGFLTSGGGWRLRCDDSGNAIATGDVTAYSDRRVKENIHTIDNALDKVNNLRGVYYTRIDSEDKQRKVGVIAQETLEILPEVVGQDTDGMYNVAYGNITAVLIEAIKEQQKQIDELKELVNQLIKK
jgi:hypothetical protein